MSERGKGIADKSLPGLPAEMTPEIRRSIFEYLAKRYDTGRQDYLAELSDEIIAKRLQFPVAWIVEIREVMFGPASNLDQVRGLVGQAEECIKSLRTTAERIRFAGESLSNIDKIVRDLEAQVPGIEMQARRIEGHLAPIRAALTK